MFSIIKGWFGEKATQFGMWAKLDSETYKRFHNVVLTTLLAPISDGPGKRRKPDPPGR